MGLIGTRIALITPVRDEEKYIGAMIESIVAQEVRPAKWIIVDDGSTDGTAGIVKRYVRQFSFIELMQLPASHGRMIGGEGAITQAVRRLSLSEFEFVARFDADLVFEEDYIVRILHEFHRDSKLGIAGGGLYIERNGRLKPERQPEYHVRGALKMYRRECFEEIGGLIIGTGWDTIDEVCAWTKGWKTRSFFQYRVIHRRPTGHGLKASRVYWERGKAEYYSWSHPAFVLAKTIRLACQSRSLTKSACFLAGFARCYARADQRLQDPAFRRTRRRQQLQRIISALTAGRWTRPFTPGDGAPETYNL